MQYIVKAIGLFGSFVFLSGCAHHVLTAREPDGTNDSQLITIKSEAFLGVKNIEVINGKEDDGEVSNPSSCDTNLLAAVHVKQNFGQTLSSILTLGAYSSITMMYECSNKPPITTTEN